MTVKPILITHELLKNFEHYKQTSSRAFESGGILLGKIYREYILIDKFTIPNKADVRKKFLFIRKKEPAQVVINKEFYDSQKKRIYIGEWHTHYESYPTPSKIDNDMIVKHFHSATLNENFLLLLIIGLKDHYLGLYDGIKLRDHKLTII